MGQDLVQAMRVEVAVPVENRIRRVQSRLLLNEILNKNSIFLPRKMMSQLRMIVRVQVVDRVQNRATLKIITNPLLLVSYIRIRS